MRMIVGCSGPSCSQWSAAVRPPHGVTFGPIWAFAHPVTKRWFSMRTSLILDVNPDPEALDWEQEFLTRIETAVIGCCGPDRVNSCPLLEGKPCSKIEAADGVLFQLDPRPRRAPPDPREVREAPRCPDPRRGERRAAGALGAPPPPR